MALTAAVALAGCLGHPAEPGGTVVAPVAPPPPRAEMPPSPPPRHEHYDWQPGYWRWNGRAYVWVPGHYAQRPHRMAVWVPGHWQRRQGGWIWIPGHWQ
jgi:hypothetical protein